MVLSLIFGIIILAIVVYIGIRIFSNIVMGIVLIALVLIASFLILGSLPNLQEIPIVGKYLPKIPTTTGDVILAIKNLFYSIEIVNVDRDYKGNLLITVANTGRMSVSNFKVFVDGVNAEITNSPKEPLGSGEITVIQVEWSKDFNQIRIEAGEAVALFSRQT